MTFKRVISESGLNWVELAELYGVSRQTIFLWRKQGPPTPAESPLGRVVAPITNALTISLDRGLLPLRDMTKEARKERVKKMARTLQGLKPAPAK